MGPCAKGRTSRRRAVVTAAAFAISLAVDARLAADVHAAAPEETSSDSVLERLERPELLNGVTVEYPETLANLPEPPRGEVVVRFTIGTDGVPRDLSVEQSLHPELDDLALAAAAQLRYRPARLDGAPVEVVNRIAVGFEPPPLESVEEPPADPDAASETTTAEEEVPTSSADDDDSPEDSDPAGANTLDASRGPVRIAGMIVEAGVRTPLAGATVVVIPAGADADEGVVRKKDYGEQPPPAWQATAQTDAEGKFEIRGIPDGKARLVVVLPGYERQEIIESIDADESLTVRYFVQRLPTNPYRTVVRVENPREEVARRTISREEINAIPGTQGDALKAIQNFPGVARAPFGIGLLAIRGTGPNDSAVYLGYHEIPQLFHFGGLTSVFNSDILARIDFIPGNFDSRYGDAIGGIIAVEPRAGRRDGYHGYIDSDLFDTGILFEGKIGKGSFALSGRRSYIDGILRFAIPADAGLNISVAPRYYDYQALFDYPVAGGNLSVRGFGSDDRTSLVAADPNDVDTDVRNQFETVSYFHRADIVYTKRKGPWDFLITPSFRHEFLKFGISDAFRLNLTTNNLTGRAEIGYRFTKNTALTVGLEYRSYWFDIDVTAPAQTGANQGGSDQNLTTRVSGFSADPGLYTTLQWGIGDRVTLYPGVRVTYYSNLQHTVVVDPRLRFGIQVAENTTLKGGLGLYSQSAQPVEFSDVFGNPRIGPERGLQSSLGVAQIFPYGITLDATVFSNYLFDNVAPSFRQISTGDGFRSENYANTQTGRVYGGEILLRKELTSNFFGWLAYTISRSERRNTPDDDWTLFDFDQTHILTLIGVYRLPRNWQVGARFRLVSGNLNTPIVGGVVNASTGSYIPISGSMVNSERNPVFHQLDIRVDKKWVWRRLSLNAYVDIQNVYNAQNVEFWNYNFDYRSRAAITSLPIIPSLGMKLEF